MGPTKTFAEHAKFIVQGVPQACGRIVAAQFWSRLCGECKGWCWIASFGGAERDMAVFAAWEVQVYA